MLILGVFAAVFLTLGLLSYTKTSATWDEPTHLTAGYAALTLNDYRVDPSHPPLVRMWSALPLLLMDDVSMTAGVADGVAPTQWLQDAYPFAHRFLYIENDADRLLYAARFMVLLLGVLLGCFVFLWAREWLGLTAATMALAAYTLEPTLLAHSTLVTTDAGVACFMFGACYFAWRTCRRFTWPSVAGLVMCFALGVAAKFSALLLVPIVAILLVVAAAGRSAMTFRRAGMVLCLMGFASFTVVWAVYGFRYAPSASPSWVFTFRETDLAAGMPRLAQLVTLIDDARLLPNAFSQGFFHAWASVDRLPVYLAGQYSTEGWWYYFPVAFLIKTPIALLTLIGLGLVACVRRRHELGVTNELFVLVPAAVCLAVAMSTGINIGVRHILPAYPLLILVAAVGSRSLLRMRRPIGLAAMALVAAVWVGELATAYPHTLTFFNQLVGGPRNGYRYLADSNLGWGQALKGLKAWMDRHDVRHVNLAYFGQADPAYYGINSTHLPGAPSFAIDAVARPKLPGYVAVSATTLSGVYAPPWWRLFYAPFRDLDPVAIVGNSIRVYWVEQWPDSVGRSGPDFEPEAHRSLGDALLLGYEWPDKAALHYEAYLKTRPDDAGALVHYGLALVASDRIGEGVAQLRRAVEVDPRHADGHLTLARALFGGRDLLGAIVHAERSLVLRPEDADAYALIGRIRLVQGDYPAAALEFERALQIAPAHADARRLLTELSDRMRASARVARLGGTLE